MSGNILMRMSFATKGIGCGTSSNVGVAQIKLNAAQLKQTLGQLGGRAIADDDPIIPQLNDLFGEHTFLLDPHGLNIVEPVEEASGPAAMSAKIVNLASWSDDDCRSSLELHEPQATDIVIALGYRH